MAKRKLNAAHALHLSEEQQQLQKAAQSCPDGEAHRVPRSAALSHVLHW